jgi:hypothetical protein
MNRSDDGPGSNEVESKVRKVIDRITSDAIKKVDEYL